MPDVSRLEAKPTELIKIPVDAVRSGEARGRYSRQHTIPSASRGDRVPDWLQQLVPPFPRLDPQWA
jgi:hypothetical protein